MGSRHHSYGPVFDHFPTNPVAAFQVPISLACLREMFVIRFIIILFELDSYSFLLIDDLKGRLVAVIWSYPPMDLCASIRMPQERENGQLMS